MPIPCNTAHTESQRWVNLPHPASLAKIQLRPLTEDQLQLCWPSRTGFLLTHTPLPVRLLDFTSDHLQLLLWSSFPTPTSAGHNLHQKGGGGGEEDTQIFNRKSL